MAEILLSTTIRRSWKVSHELPDEGRFALFDERGSQLVVLNEVGGALWQLLEGERTVADVLAELVEVAENSPSNDDAEKQVLMFLSDLLARGAIEIVG